MWRQWHRRGGRGNAVVLLAPNLSPGGAGVGQRQTVHIESYAASALLLNRRTLHRTEGAEHAAVPCVRTQQRLAVAALVEELAGVDGHRLLRGEAAVRTGQHGIAH